MYYFALNINIADKVNLFNMVIMLITLFLNPIYIISGISHVARSWDITVFEISMLGGWLKIALARIVSIIVYMIPYIIIQSTVLYMFSTIINVDKLIIIYFILSVYLYVGLSLLISIVKRRTVTLIASAAVLFIGPLSVGIILNNYLMFGAKPGLIVSGISYVLNPMLSYWYTTLHPGFMHLDWFNGVIIDVAIMILFYILFIVLFVRSEIKI